MIRRTLISAAVAFAVAVPAAYAQQNPAAEQKQAAKPKPKPQLAQMQVHVQGDTAFDPGAAILKPGGRSEIDKLLKTAREGTKRDPRPIAIGSVIISGHADKLESEALAQARARAVWGYLLSQGVSEKVMFWEGQGTASPVAVTRFCDDKLPQEELAACLQPNRRVVLQIGGMKPPKPAQEKPAQMAEQKPAAEQKSAAKQQAAKPTPKGKPQSVLVKLNVQGESAFDADAAILKPGARSEIDKLLKTAREGTTRDPRPITINAVVISGHGDRLESDPGALSEARARAVKGYLVSQGVSEDVIFWEGRGAQSPVPVTKFCDDKMPQEELATCLQPNRRVVLEIGGLKPPMPAKDSS